MKFNKNEVEYLFYVLNNHAINEAQSTKDYNNEATTINNIIVKLRKEYKKYLKKGRTK
jgi:predicted DNA-binding protein (UPF0278 family)